jgi:3D (Asp-Asp-Asp) domain-containing protein
LKRTIASIQRPLFALTIACAAAILVVAAVSESAARPLLNADFSTYRNTLVNDSLLFREIINARLTPPRAQAQASVMFRTPQLLASTPKTDELPPANVDGLSIHTAFRTRRDVFFAPAIVRFDFDLRPGTRKTVRAARPKILAITERVTLWNNVTVDHQVIGQAVVQRAQPAIIIAAPPRTVREAMALTGSHKLVAVYRMVATAYTADSAQAVPTGRTATGIPATYGVVAVDPRVIPLGTRLFIEGYGTAIAADTGGSIVGNRIDLCMDSYQRAILWGRQPVKVYVLRSK